MNRDRLIVDMESPTPIDVHRFKSKGVLDICIEKVSSNRKYSLSIKDSSTDDIVLLEECCSSMLIVWKLIEVMRSTAYKSNKTVNVLDIDSRCSYKKITLATTLKQEEIEETIERQAKLAVNTRRRFVVDTPYRKRTKKLDTRVFDRTRYASSTGRGV